MNQFIFWGNCIAAAFFIFMAPADYARDYELFWRALVIICLNISAAAGARAEMKRTKRKLVGRRTEVSYDMKMHAPDKGTFFS